MKKMDSLIKSLLQKVYVLYLVAFSIYLNVSKEKGISEYEEEEANYYVHWRIFSLIFYFPAFILSICCMFLLDNYLGIVVVGVIWICLHKARNYVIHSLKERRTIEAPEVYVESFSLCLKVKGFLVLLTWVLFFFILLLITLWYKNLIFV